MAKIQLKRSAVVEAGNVAKEPTAAQMDFGELAVNYNVNDPSLFIKNTAGTVIRIAGKGNEYGGDWDSITNKPTIGDGKLTINDHTGSLVAQFTANQVTDTTFNLPEGFTGDYNDLTNKPTIGDGSITINDYQGNTLGSFTVNQTGNATIELPETSPAPDISTLPPDSPERGQLWWCDQDGRLYIWYPDGNSDQWVPATPESQGQVPGTDGGIEIDGDGDLAIKIRPGYGVSTSSLGLQIGDDWSNIPTLPEL